MHTQIAYSTIGQKLALMSSQTLQKAMVPLTGKSLALYNSSGILYYAHSDMLGSIRLGTTPGRSMYFDTAYAPFGEPYVPAGTLDLSYTGQTNDTSSYRQDTAGGLYDFPLREYSTQGRWPNPDPLGKGSTCPKDPQTQNRYAYVRNNPMTYTDPTGGVMLPPGFGGGGFCDPDDPLCGGGGFPCYPDDPLCDPCVFEPELCYPGGGGGFIGNPNPEQPRPFPWPLLSAAVVASFQKGFSYSTYEHMLCSRLNSQPKFGVCEYLCVNELNAKVMGTTGFFYSAILKSCGPMALAGCPGTIHAVIETEWYLWGIIGFPQDAVIVGCVP